ncbi:MAG TPA: single-stranded-DNA-specific exonuclease RecJ [Candidatus Latescibacteria bacterium]|nr:single-stranded-DNA-specific exonuclease RecJ [Candidatus Latescibacterota bacterium]
MLYERWHIKDPARKGELVDVLLRNRGIDREEFRQWWRGRSYSPFQMKDMDKAVSKILDAVKRGRRMAIFGDYDADGIAGTALLLEFLRKVGADVCYILPHRVSDGYGIRPSGVEQARRMGAELIITVDNGISSSEAALRARSLGVDLVITDHHLQEGPLPPAEAVVDPNRSDDGYPFKGLSGVGVVYKLTLALSEALGMSTEPPLDLVALGTVADMAPLTNENWWMVKRGLKAIANSRRPGLRKLLEVSGNLNRTITVTTVGFHLGPRLNAAGRIHAPDMALKLLISRDLNEAMCLARELNRLNEARQRMVERGLAEAEEAIERGEMLRERILVLVGENWHVGVVGLIAQKLVQRYHRPALVLTKAPEVGVLTGSARSIRGFPITDVLAGLSRHLLTFGGHELAAGFSLQEEAFEPLREGLISAAREILTEEDLKPTLEVDCLLEPEEVNLDTVKILNALKPFGHGYPHPVFAMLGCRVVDTRRIGNGRHLSLHLEKGGYLMEAVGWGFEELGWTPGRGNLVDVAFGLEEHNWRGREAVRLVLEDVKASPEDICGFW